MATGDHIAVKRWLGLYTHHGIDIGNNEVVHFTGTPAQKRNARIEKTTMEAFLRGGKLRVIDYSKLIIALEDGNETIESLLFESRLLKDEEKVNKESRKEKIDSLISRINDLDLTVETAIRHVGEKGYHLHENNCEHFAVYCRTGAIFSGQAEFLKMWALLGKYDAWTYYTIFVRK